VETQGGNSFSVSPVPAFLLSSESAFGSLLILLMTLETENRERFWGGQLAHFVCGFFTPLMNTTTKNKPWLQAITLITSAGAFDKPEMGYGVAFTPNVIEQMFIRKDFPELRGTLEAKWGKKGKRDDALRQRKAIIARRLIPAAAKG
jgi:hypothetical protein